MDNSIAQLMGLFDHVVWWHETFTISGFSEQEDGTILFHIRDLVFDEEIRDVPASELDFPKWEGV